MKDIILKEIEIIKHRLWEINDYIYCNPELGDKEYKACERLTEFLRENGFEVEMNIVGRPTAFRAVYKSKLPGPSIAFLCEYDALPEIGHGCGHNMIGTMGAGAGVALCRVIDSIGGQIVVLGTPAEETSGAKVDMAEKGIFAGIDAAMIVHPSSESFESGISLAMDAIQFSFKGKSAHAAAEPEKGINALDAVILTFNGINALRQHIKSDVRIHGIIKEGGLAANIVPEKAVAQFYIRSLDRRYLNEVVEKVKNVAGGAALMTGAELEISNYELSYDNMLTNKHLSKTFTSNLRLLGVKDIKSSDSGYGSIDMGNVSHVVPAIHPHIGLGNPELIGHTREMADLTITEQGHDALLKGAVAMAYTGYDLIVNKKLLKQVKEEFLNSLK
jgi:amidohydrolase